MSSGLTTRNSLSVSDYYDDAGNLWRLTQPAGIFFTYDRDALGRSVWTRENGANWQAYSTDHPTGARENQAASPIPSSPNLR
jgi:YD repeat-containing protein